MIVVINASGTVIAADGLYKRDVFSMFLNTEGGIFVNGASGFPDPFAVVTVDGEQTHSTAVIRKTLNPYWNESFDLYGCYRRDPKGVLANGPIDKFQNHQ